MNTQPRTTPAPTLELGRRVLHKMGMAYSGNCEGLVVALRGEPTGDRGRPGVMQVIRAGQVTFDIITFDGHLYQNCREHDIDRQAIGGIVLLDRVHGPAMIERAHRMVAERIARDNLARVTAEQNFQRKQAERVITDAPRFYWNGMKDEKGAKLQPAYYSGPDSNDGEITIYARRYKRFSDKVRACFAVRNDSDSMTDYFCEDSIRVVTGHPLYPQVLAACNANKAHQDKRTAKRNGGAA